MPDKAIFLDRDDTIIEDSGYISSAEQVKLIPFAAGALVELRKMGYKLIVVSNQSGIARGLFTEQALAQIHEKLKLLLAEQNAYLDRIYYCPYHPDGAVAKYRKDSDWRKPKPGMLVAASKEMKISLKNSWMIGNDYRDIAAGKSAGCKTILIKSYIKPIVKTPNDLDADFEAINIKEAVNIVKRELAPKQNIEPVKLVVEEKPEILVEQPKEQPALEQQPIEQPVIEQPIQKQIEVQPFQENQTIETTKKIEPIIEQPATPADVSRTEQLLEEIKLLLKSRQRSEQFTEFSATLLMAIIMQFSVLFCLVVAIWYKLSPTGKDNAVFTAIGFAIIFQLITLTLHIMHKEK